MSARSRAQPWFRTLTPTDRSIAALCKKDFWAGMAIIAQRLSERVDLLICSTCGHLISEQMGLCPDSKRHWQGGH